MILKSYVKIDLLIRDIMNIRDIIFLIYFNAFSYSLVIMKVYKQTEHRNLIKLQFLHV